jgi:hypothetical protein
MYAPALQIVFDAADPARVAEFWRQAIGYKYQDPPSGYDSWEEWAKQNGIVDEGDVAAIVDPEGKRPRFFIQRVPEPKAVKNRLHLDIAVPGAREAGPNARELLETEAARLLDLGATRVGYQESQYGRSIVMQDPEGNEFCLH